MKKLIAIILVVLMASAFSITALADDDYGDIPPHRDQGCIWHDGCVLFCTRLPPVPIEGIGVEADSDSPVNIDIIQIDFDDENDFFFDEIVPHVGEMQGLFDEPLLWNKIPDELWVDAISQIGLIEVTNTDGSAFVGGGWITISNDDWCSTDTIRLLRFFCDTGLFDDVIDEFTYNAADGTWVVWVDDIGLLSLFFALIERGVCPEEAIKIVLSSSTSPKTSDNSIHAGIILLIVLSAAAVTVVASKKVRNHN